MTISKLTTGLLLTIFITILVLTGYLFMSTRGSDVDPYAKEKSQIDSLTTLISALEKEQLIQDSLIECYKHDLVIADQQIDSTKNRITQIQNQYGNKIKAYPPTKVDIPN